MYTIVKPPNTMSQFLYERLPEAGMMIFLR